MIHSLLILQQLISDIYQFKYWRLWWMCSQSSRRVKDLGTSRNLFRNATKFIRKYQQGIELSC